MPNSSNQSDPTLESGAEASAESGGEARLPWRVLSRWLRLRLRLHARLLQLLRLRLPKLRLLTMIEYSAVGA